MDINTFLALQNWGSVPDWFAAVGTITAVAVALRFGLRDHARLEQERKDAAADRELFRQEQAEQAKALKRRLAGKVTIVVDREWGPHPATGGPRQHLTWKVHNGGEEPISMVSIVERLRPGAPGADKAPVHIAYTWRAIEAGGQRTHLTDSYRDPSEFETFREVQFTDGSGVRWQRKESGALREIGPDDPEALKMVVMPA